MPVRWRESFDAWFFPVFLIFLHPGDPEPAEKARRGGEEVQRN